jgi:hypothetical protein
VVEIAEGVVEIVAAVGGEAEDATDGGAHQEAGAGAGDAVFVADEGGVSDEDDLGLLLAEEGAGLWGEPDDGLVGMEAHVVHDDSDGALEFQDVGIAGDPGVGDGGIDDEFFADAIDLGVEGGGAAEVNSRHDAKQTDPWSHAMAPILWCIRCFGGIIEVVVAASIATKSFQDKFFIVSLGLKRTIFS